MTYDMTADLGRPRFGAGDLDWVRYHAGGPAAPLARWRQLVRRTLDEGGWPAVRALAGGVMPLAADPRVVFTAAAALRADGPKAPGPNGLPLDALDRDELWAMSAALGAAVAADTYRPGDERVVWVGKASGTGKRPIVLADAQDRVVQKAVALVVRPLLEGWFDPLSFGFRVGRTREHALAVAGELATADRPVVLAHDLADAFGRVPVGRLLDVVEKWLPCPRLRAFLGRVLPPRSRSLGGVKQGGPLSPLMLEAYLTHFLHQPWRRAGHPVPVLRYADDLLLVAPDRAAAAAADAALRELLAPAGMRLKATFDEAVADLREQPAEWLGYRLRLAGGAFRVKLGANAYARLGQRFLAAHGKPRPAGRAAEALRHWAGQLGPCYRWADRAAVLRRATATAVEHGFEELPGPDELEAAWARSYERWRAVRRRVRRTPGYLAVGPLTLPTPTCVIW